MKFVSPLQTDVKLPLLQLTMADKPHSQICHTPSLATQILKSFWKEIKETTSAVRKLLYIGCFNKCTHTNSPTLKTEYFESLPIISAEMICTPYLLK